MSVRSNLNSSIPTVNFSLITLPSFIISNADRLFGKALLGLWALVAGRDCVFVLLDGRAFFGCGSDPKIKNKTTYVQQRLQGEEFVAIHVSKEYP